MSSVLSAIINGKGQSNDAHPTLKIIRTLSEYKGAIQKLLTVIIFYTLVSVYYNNVEGWTVEDCIYFITVTITTVGYGDFHPTTDVSVAISIYIYVKPSLLIVIYII